MLPGESKTGGTTGRIYIRNQCNLRQCSSKRTEHMNLPDMNNHKNIHHLPGMSSHMSNQYQPDMNSHKNIHHLPGMSSHMSNHHQNHLHELLRTEGQAKQTQ